MDDVPGRARLRWSRAVGCGSAARSASRWRSAGPRSRSPACRARNARRRRTKSPRAAWRRWRWSWTCAEPGAPARAVSRSSTRFGRIDILVNNASVWLRAPFLQISQEAWQMALDVNLTGPFLMSQAVAPHMLKQGSGLIVNITDLSAYQTWKEYAHHAASKAGPGGADPRHGRRACAARAGQRHRAGHGAPARRARPTRSGSGPKATRC